MVTFAEQRMYFLVNGCSMSLPSLKDLLTCNNNECLQSDVRFLTSGVPLVVESFHHHGENVVELLLLKACHVLLVLEKTKWFSVHIHSQAYQGPSRLALHETFFSSPVHL